MDVLIVGLSSIVVRRVLPALKSVPQVDRIDIATTKSADPSTRNRWTHGDVYEDYADALKRTSAEMVYVSLVNSEHERWARAGLEQGKHVVVDKPAFLGHDGARRMVELAAKHDVCLAEATVFGYHPQVEVARRLFDDGGSTPKRISMVLSFPPMDPGNFRYQAALGGGALWDVGPYLAATSRLVFGPDPITCDCRVVAMQGGAPGTGSARPGAFRGDDPPRDTSVEIAFTALATFPEGRSLVGQFGFDTAYLNRLQLFGEECIVEIDRAFTTPADYPNTIRVTGPSGASIVEVAPADAFRCFFEHVIARIEAHDWGRLATDLLADSRVLERYRSAAGVA